MPGHVSLKHVSAEQNDRVSNHHKIPPLSIYFNLTVFFLFCFIALLALVFVRVRSTDILVQQTRLNGDGVCVLIVLFCFISLLVLILVRVLPRTF